MRFFDSRLGCRVWRRQFPFPVLEVKIGAANFRFQPWMSKLAPPISVSSLGCQNWRRQFSLPSLDCKIRTAAFQVQPWMSELARTFFAPSLRFQNVYPSIRDVIDNSRVSG